MKYKPPFANAEEYLTLEHLPTEYKQDIEEWIAEASKSIDEGFWAEKWSAIEKERYRSALSHLHYAMQIREWI